MTTSSQPNHRTSSAGRYGSFAGALPIVALSLAWLHAPGVHAGDQRAEPSTPKKTTLDVVPGRVSTHYAIVSAGNEVRVERTETGAWSLAMSILSPARKGEESWAGYCWDINQVNGNDFRTLKATFDAVTRPVELQFKLEQKDNRTQERVLRFPTVRPVVIPLSNYPAVRPAIARFCLAMAVNAEAKTPVHCEVTLSSVVFE